MTNQAKGRQTEQAGNRAYEDGASDRGSVLEMELTLKSSNSTGRPSLPLMITVPHPTHDQTQDGFAVAVMAVARRKFVTCGMVVGEQKEAFIIVRAH